MQLEHFSGTMRLGVLLDELEPKKHMLPLSLFCVKPWAGRRLLYAPFLLFTSDLRCFVSACRTTMPSVSARTRRPYCLALSRTPRPKTFSERPAVGTVVL